MMQLQFLATTSSLVPDDVKRDLCAQRTEGDKLLSTFVVERIQRGTVSLWAQMKKRKLLTWKSTGKKSKVNVNDKIVELQEDRSLFARMMVVCRSRPEINLQESIGIHEFTVVPRSLFAADGSMLHCSNKSALMGLLENEAPASTTSNEPTTEPVTKKIDIVDGMAELQSLDKLATITTCADLAEHFTETILRKHRTCYELHLVFDRYDVPLSLKSATRVRRQGNEQPVFYRITDTTFIAKVPLKRLLAHTRTKMELTKFLAANVLRISEQREINVVVAWASQCKATHRDVTHLQSSQEEADTKMILHAVDAVTQGATEVNIFSPDTDVFILSLRRYPELCGNVNFVTGSGQRQRVIKLQPIVQALGSVKISALPALHALSGADITGSFAGKGKASWWKVFRDANGETITALARLGTRGPPTADTMAKIERLVCQLYYPGTKICTVKELRWLLFRKKQAQSERLPPTQAALRQTIMRANFQTLVWNLDTVAEPDLPSPKEFGWKEESGQWLPVMTPLLPAPEAIIELVKCSCSKSHCSTNRCNCRKAQLNCTDLCGCSDSSEPCSNQAEDAEYDSDESDDTEM